MRVATAPAVHLSECGSTNTEAMARALSGAPLPFWLRADRQSAGKGRAGRVWVSGEGNLQISLALRLACPPATAAQLSLVAGVAVVEALHEVAPVLAPHIRLKWPNDILLGRAKLGGILVETASAAGGLISVAGIGVNVASHPLVEGREVTSLSAHGCQCPVETLVAGLQQTMDSALGLWEEGAGFGSIRDRWLAAALPAGTQLKVQAGRGPVEGAFCGLDPDGALLIEMAGEGVARFTFGDVMLAD